MTQPKLTILCVPITRGVKVPLDNSTGQPRSSMYIAFFSYRWYCHCCFFFWKLCWSLNLGGICSYAEVCAAARVCCLCRKGVSLFADLLLKRSRSPKRLFSLYRCVGKSGSHWTNEDITAYQHRPPVKHQENMLASSLHSHGLKHRGAIINTNRYSSPGEQTLPN